GGWGIEYCDRGPTHEGLLRHKIFRRTYIRNGTRLDRPRTLPPNRVFKSTASYVSSTVFTAVPPSHPFVTSSTPVCHRRRSSSPALLSSGKEFEKTSIRQVDHRTRGFLRWGPSEVRSGQKSLQAMRRDRRLPSEAFDQLKRLLEAKQYEVKLLLEKHGDLLDPLTLRQAYVHHTLNSKLAESMRIQGGKSKSLHERVREMNSRRWSSDATSQSLPLSSWKQSPSQRGDRDNSESYYDEGQAPIDPQQALQEADIPHRMSVGCDLKRRSCTNLSVNPRRLSFSKAGDVAVDCATAGADILLVNTNKEGWGGCYDDLEDACKALRGAFNWADRPAVVMKDIIIHPIQIAQAVEAKADGVYLHFSIVCKELDELLAACALMGTQALVEVHDVIEARQAEEAGATLFVVNNWDRYSGQLSPSLEHALEVRSVLSPEVMTLVSGGVSSLDQMIKYAKSGFDGIIMGQALTRPNALELIQDAKAWHGPPRELLHLFAPNPHAAAAAAGFLSSIEESISRKDEKKVGKGDDTKTTNREDSVESKLSSSEVSASEENEVKNQCILPQQAKGECRNDESSLGVACEHEKDKNMASPSRTPSSQDGVQDTRESHDEWRRQCQKKQEQVHQHQQGQSRGTVTISAQVQRKVEDDELDIATKVYEELQRGWNQRPSPHTQSEADEGVPLNPQDNGKRSIARGPVDEEEIDEHTPREREQREDASGRQQQVKEKASSVLGTRGSSQKIRKPQQSEVNVEDHVLSSWGPSVETNGGRSSESLLPKDKEHRNEARSSHSKGEKREHPDVPILRERVIRQSGPAFQPRSQENVEIYSSRSTLHTPRCWQQRKNDAISLPHGRQRPRGERGDVAELSSSSSSSPRIERHPQMNQPSSTASHSPSFELPPIEGITDLTRDSDDAEGSYGSGPLHHFSRPTPTQCTEHRTDPADRKCLKSDDHSNRERSAENDNSDAVDSEPTSEHQWLRAFSRELLDQIEREQQISQVCAEEQRDQQLAMFRQYQKLVNGPGQSNEGAGPDTSLFIPPPSLTSNTYHDPLAIIEESKNESTSISKPFREAFPHEPARAAEACTAAAAAAIANPTAFAEVARDHLQRAVDKGAYTMVKGADPRAQLLAAAPTQEIAEAMAEATAAAVTADDDNAVSSNRKSRRRGAEILHHHDAPSPRALAAAAAEAINERRAKGVRPDLLAAPFTMASPSAPNSLDLGAKGIFGEGSGKVLVGSEGKQEAQSKLILSGAPVPGKHRDGQQQREGTVEKSVSNRDDLQGTRDVRGGRDFAQEDSTRVTSVDGGQEIFDEVELARVGRLFLTEEELTDFVQELRKKKATKQVLLEEQERSRFQQQTTNEEQSEGMIGRTVSASTSTVTTNSGKKGEGHTFLRTPPQTNFVTSSVRALESPCLESTAPTAVNSHCLHQAPATGSISDRYSSENSAASSSRAAPPQMTLQGRGEQEEKVFTRFGRFQPGPPSVTPADQMEAYLPFFQGHRAAATHQHHDHNGSNTDDDRAHAATSGVHCDENREPPHVTTRLTERADGTGSNEVRGGFSDSPDVTSNPLSSDRLSSEISSVLSAMPRTSAQAYQLLLREEQRQRPGDMAASDQDTSLSSTGASSGPPTHVLRAGIAGDASGTNEFPASGDTGSSPAKSDRAALPSVFERMGMNSSMSTAGHESGTGSGVFQTAKGEISLGEPEANEQAEGGNVRPSEGRAPGRTPEDQKEKTTWDLLVSGHGGASVAGGFLQQHVRDLASSGGIEIDEDGEG
ncbi:indole-3-glycerol phosphate synthase domain-containing protein, partial [Cystoisospora suis]